MNINTSKIGAWWEDENNKVLKESANDEIPEGAVTYHSCFPLTVIEDVYAVHTPQQKLTCKHQRKYWKRDDSGLRKGFKSHMCMNCGCTQIRKRWQPWGRKWNKGTKITPLVSWRTAICNGEDVILGMVNSGDYTLEEAIGIYASSCERCTNVLAYKYTNGADGYAEHSEEWEKCNTVCDFCKDE